MIDVDTRESPGWWLKRLSTKLNDRLPRLAKLAKYREGDPPLPEGAENARRAYRAFQSKSRTNYAYLITEAKRTRMIPTGFLTAAEGDENGDAEAAQIWRENGLPVESAEVHRSMLDFGDGYVIVGRADDGRPVVTAEDPRQVVTEHDPVQQRRVRAALKVFYDDVAGRDLAYLYLPGKVRVAYRERRRSALARSTEAKVRFSPSSWDWDLDLSADLPAGFEDFLGVVRFRNQNGIGEFERHLDHLDRINHMLLQRMVIATVQAFRQRAIKGNLPTLYPADHPRAGEVIDYDQLFAADPGALWLLPEAAEMWESGQVNLTPILTSVKDDVRDLSAVTFTPLHYTSPDAANGSAEGASLMREGLVFQVEDRIARASDGWSQVMSLAFRITGDTDRADLGGLRTLWVPPERYSLAERYDAAVKAGPAGVPWRTVMTDVLQFTPETVARMEAERAASEMATVRAQVAEANRLTGAEGLSQAAAYATVGLVPAASQISADNAPAPEPGPPPAARPAA